MTTSFAPPIGLSQAPLLLAEIFKKVSDLHYQHKDLSSTLDNCNQVRRAIFDLVNFYYESHLVHSFCVVCDKTNNDFQQPKVPINLRVEVTVFQNSVTEVRNFEIVEDKFKFGQQHAFAANPPMGIDKIMLGLQELHCHERNGWNRMTFDYYMEHGSLKRISDFKIMFSGVDEPNVAFTPKPSLDVIGKSRAAKYTAKFVTPVIHFPEDADVHYVRATASDIEVANHISVIDDNGHYTDLIITKVLDKHHPFKAFKASDGAYYGRDVAFVKETRTVQKCKGFMHGADVEFLLDITEPTFPQSTVK